MATMPVNRKHHFHAESTVLHADLKHPLHQEIKPQAFVKLSEGGGYLSEHSQDFRVEGVVSYEKAYTHVAGHRSSKTKGGWITLVTSAVENLNILDVVTADRVVAQISTNHPDEGYIPGVTFLGTRFENLRIAGEPVTAKLNINILGPKPANDGLYLEDSAFLKQAGLTSPPPGVGDEWKKHIEARKAGKETPKPNAAVNCSLATGVTAGPWKTSGNMIDVPDFGKVFLAELKVECETFHLTMIRLDMGCLAAGIMTVGGEITNGHTYP